jgi:hypothetical protein
VPALKAFASIAFATHFTLGNYPWSAIGSTITPKDVSQMASDT